MLLLLMLCFGAEVHAAATGVSADVLTAAEGAESLDRLLQTEVTVASGKPLMPNEAPAVITVITREEIERSGARDLVDVLQAVPGIEFGADIWNLIGPGFRGIWAHEGKYKLLIDGMPANDVMYGAVGFGNHYPVELIERVEVLRGPGSTLYGNFAELAVINIITKIGREIDGAQITSATGAFDQGFSRQNFTARYGRSIGQDGYFGMSASGGVGQRSNGNYIDPNGEGWRMYGNSDLQAGSIELNARLADFTARFYYDNYFVKFGDGTGLVLPDEQHVRFIKYLGLLSYDFRLTPSLTLTPALKVAIDQPWQHTDVPKSDPAFYDITAQIYTPSVTASWDVSNRASTIAGVEHEEHVARYGGSEPYRNYLFPGRKQKMTVHRTALYNDWLLKTSLCNIAAGARYEYDSIYGPALVPRLSLTRTFGDTTLKAIYNRAYRYPTIEQTSGAEKAGVDLKTESANIYEFEISHRIDSNNHLSINFFDSNVYNPVVYRYDETRSIDSYLNAKRLGSSGIESEYRFQRGPGHLTVRYAYYRAASKSAADFRVPGRDVHIGFPSHKATVDAGYAITSGLHINGSIIYRGDRYYYSGEASEPVRKYGAKTTGSIFLLQKNLFTKGVDVGIGVFNLFGGNDKYLLRTNWGHNTLPGPAREYLLRLSYTPPV